MHIKCEETGDENKKASERNGKIILGGKSFSELFLFESITCSGMCTREEREKSESEVTIR